MDLLNGILNGGLGSDYTHAGGSYSSSNGGTQTSYWDNSAEIEARNTKNASIAVQKDDPYRQHVFRDASTDSPYILLSDGSNVWKIGGKTARGDTPIDTQGVAATLHEWLTTHYRHGLVDGSEPGYDFDRGGFKVSTGQSGSSRRGGSYSGSTGGSTIYVPDPNKTSAYNTALVNGKVITLTQVLQSVNPSTHVFYVPIGYYYQGNVSEAPSVSNVDANDASNRAGFNKTAFDIEQPSYNTASTTSEDNDNIILYLMLPLLAIVGAKFLKKNNKRKKR